MSAGNRTVKLVAAVLGDPAVEERTGWRNTAGLREWLAVLLDLDLAHSCRKTAARTAYCKLGLVVAGLTRLVRHTEKVAATGTQVER